ncbi:MAG: hypothetical protein ACI9VX_000937, partial [Dinoroseobacter sp.]
GAKGNAVCACQPKSPKRLVLWAMADQYCASANDSRGQI